MANSVAEKASRGEDIPPRGARFFAGVTLGTCAAYFTAASVALYFFATPEQPAAIWFASGVTLAIMLLAPKRMWPGILAAVLVAGTVGNFINGKSFLLSFGLGIADVAESLFTAALLLWYCGRNVHFTRLKHFIALLLFSAIGGNALAAAVGATAFTLSLGPRSDFVNSWWMWFASNGMGILVVTPFIVSFATIKEHRVTLKGARLLEAVLLLAALATIAIVVFGHISVTMLVLPYGVFPFLIWAALRFGVPGASSAAVVLASITVWATAHGFGPLAFASGTMYEWLIQTQAFVTAALACSLIPAIVMTERRDAERRLKRSEERLALAQDIAGLGSFVFDPTTSKISWSDNTFHIMSRDPKLGAPSFAEMLTSVHPEDRQVVGERMQSLVTDGQSFDMDFRYIWPDGSLRYLHAIGRPVVDDRTSRTLALGTVMDLTDRKRIEEELRQAQKMEAVGRLAGGVAHDFNNLLGVILGYSELALSMLRPEDPLQSKIQPISKAATRAASLTAQLLAFSRKQVLKPQALNLNTVVGDLGRMLRRVIGEQIELVLQLSPLLPVVEADPGQVEQVVLNLAVNAKDAMADGGRLVIRTAELQVTAGDSDRPIYVPAGKYALLTVSDTGHGMDEFTKAHIFEPFFTTKEKNKGTGLGLATVYGIVNQSHGYIWVESRPGAGACFYICLPGVDRAVEAEDEAPGDGAAGPRRCETVLLVEDENPLRQLIRDVLSGMGCAVLEASSGEEAIRLARENGHIDVLLTDVIMPKMNGFELSRRIAEVRPEIKILYMSGYSDDLIARHDQTGREPNFIQKPFTPEELRDKLHEIAEADTSRRG